MKAMTEAESHPGSARLDELVGDLESIANGDGAMYALVAAGQEAVPFIESYLVRGKPRSLSEGRVRAVKALGLLRALPSLLLYLDSYQSPADAVVLFAEDAVRSAAANELIGWKTDEVYGALVKAAAARATPGLIKAIGEFERPSSMRLLFSAFEDDICRDEAINAVRRLPAEGCAYALAYLHGRTDLPIAGPRALRRVRTTLDLLYEWTLPDSEWPWIKPFVESADPSTALRAIALGIEHSSEEELPLLFARLLDISDRLNWLEEAEAFQLLKRHLPVAQEEARKALAARTERGEQPHWISRAWRLLDSVLDNELSHPHGQLRLTPSRRHSK